MCQEKVESVFKSENIQIYSILYYIYADVIRNLSHVAEQRAKYKIEAKKCFPKANHESKNINI